MICLLPNCCFLSETSRMLEIYRALVARGAPVRMATHGGTHERLLAVAGVAYDLLGPTMSEERCAAFVRSVPGIGSPDQNMWSDEELRTYVSAEADYFRAHDVQVAVTGWTLTALLSTRVVDMPLVCEHAGSFLPPLFERGLLPAPSSAIGMPLERWLPAGLRRRLFNAGVERLDIYTAGFNRVARELGVAGIPSFPALLLGHLSLVTDVPAVLGISREDVDRWTPRHPARYRPGVRLRYAGPIHAHFDVPVPERVDRFLDGDRPIVYVALTSSRPELARDVVGAMPAEARLVVAGTVHDLSDLASERVLVEGVLPSHLILPRVDVAVVTGGQGSVQAALSSGVPLAGIPLQPEQDANVALAEHQRAARLVPPGAAGSARMTSAVRALLAGERYRASARRVQAAFARVDGPAVAADVIVELAGRPERRAHGGRPALARETRVPRRAV